MDGGTSVGIYQGVKIGYYVMKHIPTVAEWYGKLTHQLLNDIWCTCWQIEASKPPVYEVGTMVLSQIGKSIEGTIYCADKKSSVKGTYKNGTLNCTYKMGKEDHGFFRMMFSDEGQNKDRLKGDWYGLVRDRDGSVVFKKGVAFYGARNGCVSRECHQSKLSGNHQGLCLTRDG